MDSVFLTDHSAFLPWWHITSVDWTIDGSGGYTDSVLTVLLSSGGSHTIMETVSGTRPGGTFSCSYEQTITLPGLPQPFFYVEVAPLCSTVPIYFYPASTAGIIGYNWNFGDGATVLVENPQRAFTYLGGIGGSSTTFPVNLTVTDSIGCTADSTENVLVEENRLAGNTGPVDIVVCANSLPVTLSFNSTGTMAPEAYLWSTGATSPTIAVNSSGAYWVTVEGPYQCQSTFNNPYVTNVDVLIVPPAQITGLQNYCTGQTVSLSGYAGDNVIYQWYQNGSPDGNNPTIADAGLDTGTYNYQLMLGVTDSTGLDTCYDTSSVYTVYMHPLPPPPTITGPTAINCSIYQVELAASEDEGGTYNWNDGTVSAADNNIYSGGAYEVWFTDVYGCISSATANVPMSPEYYFQYFPTGCYNLCKQQLPLTLYGPPGAPFANWYWIVDDSVAEEGSGSMSPFVVDSGGDYQWKLDNGLCAMVSGDMNINVTDCGCSSKLSSHLTCSPSNPDCYVLSINVSTTEADATYVLGTDTGPLTPFSGTFAAIGSHPLTLTFTTFTPPLDSITVEVIVTYPDGSQCYQSQRLLEPGCTWTETGRTEGSDTSAGGNTQAMDMQTAMLVYPNPTSGTVSISYDYGSGSYAERSVEIYDAMGRKTQSITPQDIHGNWSLNTGDWAPGIYIVRMEGDGKTLQTQRVVVTR